MKFFAENVVSLGAWCQLTYQLRHKFKRSSPSCFDWAVTPLESLIRCIEDDGEKLGQAVRVMDNEMPLCHHYGISYHHEFVRSGRIPIITENDLRNCRSKFRYKYSQMVTGCEETPTLFVRFGGHVLSTIASPYLTEEKVFTSHDANRLAGLLRAKFPTTPFRLLIVTSETITPTDFSAPLDDRILVREIAFKPLGSPWEGDSAEWSGLFDSLPMSFNIRSGEQGTNPYHLESVQDAALQLENLH